MELFSTDAASRIRRRTVGAKKKGGGGKERLRAEEPVFLRSEKKESRQKFPATSKEVCALFTPGFFYSSGLSSNMSVLIALALLCPPRARRSSGLHSAGGAAACEGEEA